jgi:hypothetical protein
MCGNEYPYRHRAIFSPLPPPTSILGPPPIPAHRSIPLTLPAPATGGVRRQRCPDLHTPQIPALPVYLFPAKPEPPVPPTLPVPAPAGDWRRPAAPSAVLPRPSTLVPIPADRVWLFPAAGGAPQLPCIDGFFVPFRVSHRLNPRASPTASSPRLHPSTCQEPLPSPHACGATFPLQEWATESRRERRASISPTEANRMA